MTDTDAKPAPAPGNPAGAGGGAPARPLFAGRLAVVLVYTAAMCMNGLDSTIVNPALFTIAGDFGRPVSAANAVETAFLVGLAVGLPAAGWLGDRFGVRRVFLGSLAVFTLASALCAAAPGLGALTAARAAQGVAGGLLTPVGMTLLFRAFEPHERAGLGKVLIVPTALMPALGPPLGGFLTEHLSWHWLFLVNVPIGVAAVLTGVFALRDQEEPPAGRFDTTGFLLATPAWACSPTRSASAPRTAGPPRRSASPGSSARCCSSSPSGTSCGPRSRWWTCGCWSTGPSARRAGWPC